MAKRRRSKPAAALLLGVIVGGPPAAIGMLWGVPTAERVTRLVSLDAWQGSTKEVLVGAIALLCWVSWVWMMAAAGAETVALRRGHVSADASAVRRGLRPLLAAVMLKGVLAGSVLSVVGASQAWAHPHVEAEVAQVEAEPADEQSEGALGAYRVVQHDTLWGIAERFLSDGMRWRDVYELSKDGVQNYRGEMTDPNLIFPGDIVLLPNGAAEVPEPPSVEEIEAVYGETVAARTRGASQAGSGEASHDQPAGGAAVVVGPAGAVTAAVSQPQRAAPDAVSLEEAAAAVGAGSSVVEATPAQAEPARPVELERFEASAAAAVGAGSSVVEATPAQAEPARPVELERFEASAEAPVGAHSLSMGDMTTIPVGSVSLLTLGGLGAMMLRRRRRAAAERAVGEIPEPLRQELAAIEKATIAKMEEIVPWAQWLAAAVGDLMARRPLGAARVDFVEGSDSGVEVLLTERCATDWGPWLSVHGANRTVLSLAREAEGLSGDVDGWAAMPLLITVGERLCLNFEAAGVVAAVAAQDGTGGVEAMRGLCRAIVSEVTCRSAECEVDLWITERAAMQLGQCVNSDAATVMGAGALDEEVSEVWRDVSSRRAQAMLQLQMSVDDDRKAEFRIGSCLVICDSSETEAMPETMRLASEARHNLAVMVMGAHDTDTSLELSVPAGEMVVHPWGIRVSACYASAPTATAMAEAAMQPVRMLPREPLVAEPRGETVEPDREVRAISQRPEPVSPAPTPKARQSSTEAAPERFSAESAAEMHCHVGSPNAKPTETACDDSSINAGDQLEPAPAAAQAKSSGSALGQWWHDRTEAREHAQADDSVDTADDGEDLVDAAEEVSQGVNGLRDPLQGNDSEQRLLSGVEQLPEQMRGVLRRSEPADPKQRRLAPHVLDVLRMRGNDARWAVLTVGPMRVVKVSGGDAGIAVEALNEAASLAALIVAGGGALSSEEAQSRLQFGANATDWDQTLQRLREAFGDDFVDDPAAMRLNATVADLAFFESIFDKEHFEAGLELLRGDVFEGIASGPVVWVYDSLVEQTRFVVADWCVTHGRRLFKEGDVAAVRRVVAKGLLSQPFDRALLELDMQCAFEQDGIAGAERRVSEHASLGTDNGEFAAEALQRVSQKRSAVVRA